MCPTPAPISAALRPMLLAGGLLLGSACAESAFKGSESDTGWAATATPPADSGAADTEMTLPDAQYRGWEGSVRLVEGAWDLGSIDTALRATIWSAGEQICELRPAILSASIATAPGEPGDLFGWWQLSLGEVEDASCPYTYPTDLSIGIGAMHPSLLPAISEAGYDASTLNGLYIQEGEASDLWVFGVAGTEEQLEGSQERQSSPALPDGIYYLVGLFQLPR